MKKKPIIKYLFLPVLLLCSCQRGGSVDLIDNQPEIFKKEKRATFYGTDALEMCEVYRKVYAGFCDTTSQPFVKCFDLNDKKYKFTSCQE
jgi:hypothetical protein